jgi:hypothetical protein
VIGSNRPWIADRIHLDPDRYIPDQLQPWRTAEDTSSGSGAAVTFVDVLAALKSVTRPRLFRGPVGRQGIPSPMIRR